MRWIEISGWENHQTPWKIRYDERLSSLTANPLKDTYALVVSFSVFQNHLVAFLPSAFKRGDSAFLVRGVTGNHFSVKLIKDKSNIGVIMRKEYRKVTDRMKSSVKMCQSVLQGVWFRGDLDDFREVSEFLDKYLDKAKAELDRRRRTRERKLKSFYDQYGDITRRRKEKRGYVNLIFSCFSSSLVFILSNSGCKEVSCPVIFPLPAGRAGWRSREVCKYGPAAPASLD